MQASDLQPSRAAVDRLSSTRGGAVHPPLLAALQSLWPLLAVGAAVWPLWGYLWRAYTSPGADAAAWTVLLGAVGAALWIAVSTQPPGWSETRSRALALAIVALGVYAAAYLWLPPLARAAAALMVLGLALRALPGVAERGGWGLAALVVLGAPATDTLNFFVGGVLRAASAHGAAALLLGGGRAVRVEEASLWVDGRLFSVDAPCSGVNGLWTGLIVAAAIAAWRRLGPGGTLSLLAASVALCVPANGWRAASLVYLSALDLPVWIHPDTAHAAIGLIVFGCTVLALIGLGHLTAEAENRIVKQATRLTALAPRLHARPVPCVLVLLAALAAPLLPAKGAAATQTQFPGWPQEWGVERLRRLPETEMDRRWAALSPGPVARFALDDGSEMLLRWVDRPTRALHPPEDCYRGAGAHVMPLPPVRSSLFGGGSALWRRCRVSQDGQDWEVRSLIRSQSGQVYSDPAWWWWKVAGPGASDPGPWWAVTIQKRL